MKKYIQIIALFIFGLATAQNWQTDFEKAKAQAQKENKNIMLVFSGSDWCAPCIKLDRAIWQSEEFKKESQNWVIYKADFPKKKDNQLSPELTAANKKLAEKYNAAGNFPLVVVLDKNGKVLGMKGYEKKEAADYLKALQAFVK
uniref:thioredoxin family protein n=1 Tax=Flavobacterium sp. TaxID=239 RepID=UPI00404AC99E